MEKIETALKRSEKRQVLSYQEALVPATHRDWVWSLPWVSVCVWDRCSLRFCPVPLLVQMVSDFSCKCLRLTDCLSMFVWLVEGTLAPPMTPPPEDNDLTITPLQHISLKSLSLTLFHTHTCTLFKGKI